MTNKGSTNLSEESLIIRCVLYGFWVTLCTGAVKITARFAFICIVVFHTTHIKVTFVTANADKLAVFVIVFPVPVAFQGRQIEMVQINQV